MPSKKESPSPSMWTRHVERAFLVVTIVVLLLYIQVHDASLTLSGLQPSNDDAADGLQVGQETASEAAVSPFCARNPYLGALSTNHDEIQLYGQQGIADIRRRANVTPHIHHDHRRFDVFKKMANGTLDCVGGPCKADTSKIMVGLAQLQQPDKPCVVYSIGGNNHWEFEVDVLAKTNCEVHTFDCTGEESRFIKPDNDRLHFHYECLHGGLGEKQGPNFLTLEEISTKYGHPHIDLFKMDIEGYEFGVFEYMKSLPPGPTRSFLPMQMLVEIHYRSQFLWDRRVDWKSESDMIDLAQDLFDMGYIVAERDDNRACRHCTELTLIRAYC